MKQTLEPTAVAPPPMPEGISAPAEIDNRTIGRILRDMGKLSAADEPRVFRLHREKSIRFGEAARLLRLVSNADIQYALSVQFGMPYVYGAPGALGEDLAAALDPFDPQLEALRNLRTELLLNWFGEDRRVLALVSIDHGDGRSYIAANLAVMFAQAGERTLLIDADLRNPRQHRIFRLIAGRGLAHSLQARAMNSDVQRVPYFENLFILPAGAVPPNPSELLSRPALTTLLKQAAREFSVVLIDTSAALRGSDAQLVATRARGALLVARNNRTRLGPLREMQESFGRSGVQVAGAVLNRY
jgi:protein-tyrosine kinase